MVEDKNVPEDEGVDLNRDENTENESTKAPDIPTPIMGGLQKQSDGYWTAWTGGEPNSKWTALLKETPSSIIEVDLERELLERRSRVEEVMAQQQPPVPLSVDPPSYRCCSP